MESNLLQQADRVWKQGKKIKVKNGIRNTKVKVFEVVEDTKIQSKKIIRREALYWGKKACGLIKKGLHKKHIQ